MAFGVRRASRVSSLAELVDISVVTAVRTKLPSISVLLVIFGLVLVVPLTFVAVLQLRSASADVEAASRVQQSADRLATLVRLQPAVNDEILTTGLAAGEAAEFNQFPGGGSLLSVDGETAEDDATARVDELLEELESSEISDQIRNARASIDDSVESVIGAGGQYDDVQFTLNLEVERTITELNSAAGATGNESTSEAAILTAAAAELQSATVELDGLWFLLEVSEFIPTSVDNVARFSTGLQQFDERSTILENLVPATGPVRRSWNDVRFSEELNRVLPQYRLTSDRLIREGLDANTTGQVTGMDLENITITEITSALALAERIERNLVDSEALSDRLDQLLETTIAELSTSAENSLDDANRRRQISQFSLLAAAFVALLTFAVVVLLISKPMRRLADVAERISMGQLNVQIPETGPREIRTGARALNEALASLRHVESQAVAIAEQRLDDPVLDDAAPGALGSSLQIAVTRLAGSVAERDEIQVRLQHEATHDSLTQLPNRRALTGHLQDRYESDEEFGLLFIDLDDFKVLNDTYGHRAGDEVLSDIASRLRLAMDSAAFVARLGGDEFVIVTEPVSSPEDVRAIAARALAEVRQPVVLTEATITPCASIGAALSGSAAGPGKLLRDADLALYESKERSKGSIVVCDNELRQSVDGKIALREAIQHGIDNGEFVLHYQSAVSAKNHSVNYREALIRWDRGNGKLTGPFDFIPIAEDSDLIIEIDRWVLDEVGRTIAESPAMFDASPIAMNISARHLSSGRLAANVTSMIQRYDIDPSSLIIEVTETALLDDFDAAEKDLAEIRELGVLVALDDFGTGYMSLAYLRSFPVDILKIDKSFVQQLDSPENRSILQLIIDTGHVLSLRIVAEGVETLAHSKRLTAMGADILQGYWFAKPGPLEMGEDGTTALAA